MEKPLCILLLTIGIVIAQTSYSHAYRPFESTDADVVDKREVEIELGIFTLSNENDSNEITTPNLVINYGISPKLEFIVEGDLQIHNDNTEDDIEILDPGVFVKGVLMEGLLQDKVGPSIAVEAGTLLPSTVEGEKDAGIESIVIFSDNFEELAYHLNAGILFDRANFDPGVIWGTILEYPYPGKFRMVAELNGQSVEDRSSELSALFGFIWEAKYFDYDLGIRKGISDAASDWEFTAGVTFSF